ncbi:MAG: hypothetical protein CM1200mP4_0900 [Rhodospirillaceae bacterium]|nr:MAG: hypothetical protein CM1200mP4_0900 [Rhodospirillaceae bacterium]
MLVETVPFTPEEAAAAEEGGIDTMKVRFDPNNPAPAIAMREAAPHTFMAFSVLSLPRSEEEAIRLGYKAMSVGADAIMCQWSPKFISQLPKLVSPFRGTLVWVSKKKHMDGRLKSRR